MSFINVERADRFLLYFYHVSEVDSVRRLILDMNYVGLYTGLYIDLHV